MGILECHFLNFIIKHMMKWFHLAHAPITCLFYPQAHSRGFNRGPQLIAGSWSSCPPGPMCRWGRKSRPRLCGGWLPTPASSVEPASTRGSWTNMRVTRSLHSLLRIFLLPCFISMLASTCTGVAASRKFFSQHPMLTRSSRSQNGAHHRPLTDEQKADQNLQFMLSLYRSAAEPDGRPKQHRKFGSNTVRLLRPSASTVRYLPSSKGEIKIS